MKVWVLGRGKLGSALAAGLHRAGISVELRSARRPLLFAAARGRTFVLAVPDPAIRQVAQRLAEVVGKGDVVLHCAGARGPEELEACSARGAATAAMHPLVSFASRQRPAPLVGSSFVVAGAPRALRRARQLCRALGARCVPAPVLGPAYHAAAALLANGSAALAFEAVEILVALGMARREAERALQGLLASVAHNVGTSGVPAALTGPVARGDAATVRRHLRALRALDPARADAYRRVQPVIQRCAAAQRVQLAQRQRARQRQSAR